MKTGNIGVFFITLLSCLSGGALMAFVVSAWALFALLAYGLLGVEIKPPSGRAVAFLFSLGFVSMFIVGMFRWTKDLIEAIAAKFKDAAK